MQSPLPPHFHKEDRISEIDILPDSRIVDVAPDWPAPEGSEITYVNGSTIRRYKMVNGTWEFWSFGGSGFNSRVLVYRGTSNQSLSAATPAKVQLNTEVYDDNTEFDPTTNHRFTPTEAGYYLANFQWTWADSGDGKYKEARIDDSGGPLTRAKTRPGATGEASIIVSQIFFLDVGNYLEFFAESEDAQNIKAGLNYTYVSIHRLS